MSAASPVRVGLIGYGHYGRFLIESWRGMPEAQVLAVAGTNPQRLELASRGMRVPRAYVGHERMLADPDLDVVVIASQPALHARHAIDAAKAGKHIYCEKPLAIDPLDAEAVLSAVRAAGVRAVMGYVMRYTPIARRLRQIVAEGLLGELHRIDVANFAADESLPPDHWFWDRSRSGGILVEHGVHFFDLYTWIAGGRMRRATGHSTIRHGTGQEDRVVATIEYDNGVLATFYHAFDKPTRLESTRAHLGFDRGYAHITGWIPLCLEVDAALDDRQYARLIEICPEAAVSSVDEVSNDDRYMSGGGRRYRVTKRVTMRCLPAPDKQAVYAEAARAVLMDLVSAIRDRTHRVSAPLEAGLESLRMAVAAR